MIRALCLAVLALPLAPALAHAYTLRRAPDGTPVSWSTARVELRVDPDLAHDDDRALALVARAADAWRSVPGAPEFAVVGRTVHRPGYHPGRGENGVYLVRGRWDHGSALAVTVTTATESGQILDTDVLVSDRDDLVRDDDREARARGFDLLSVLTHELGHALGLGESEVREATMFPRLSRGDIGPRTLSADDEEGVLTIYEPAAALFTATHATGCSASPVSRSALPALAILLGIAALLARRGRGIAWAVTPLALVLVVGFHAPEAIELVGPDEAALAALSAPGLAAVEIVRTEVELRDGLFVTLASTEDGRTFEVPGGARDGLVQIVGDVDPPRVGDVLVVAPSGAWAHVDGARVWGGSLRSQLPVELPTAPARVP